jgi:carboxyl-terminal processing protease
LIETVKLITVVEQDNIYAEIDSTAGDAVAQVGMQYGAIGGLLGALIAAGMNSAQNSKAQKQIAPIKESLLETNFGAELTSQLKERLSEIEWINIQSSENFKNFEDDDLGDVLVGMDENSLLVVRTSYRLSNTFNILYVESDAEVYMKDKGKDCPFHSNVFYISEPLGLNDKSELVKAWSEHEGTRIKAAIKEAIEETASLLAYELQVDEEPEDTDGYPLIVSYSGENRQFVRTSDGRLISRIEASATEPDEEALREASDRIARYYYSTLSLNELLVAAVKEAEKLAGPTDILVNIDDQPFVKSPVTGEPYHFNSINEQEIVKFVGAMVEIFDFYQEKNPDYTSYQIFSALFMGMSQYLDPSTQLLCQDNMPDSSDPSLCGIGIEICYEDNYITVVTPLPNSPAHKAGIEPGDRIVAIDNKSLNGLALEEVVKKLKGPDGTQVTLDISRDNVTEPIHMSLVREIPSATTIYASFLEPNYAYLWIQRLCESTLDEIEISLNNFDSDAAPLQGLIIDLRNNSGGLLDTAVQSSDIFIEEGVIANMQGRSKEYCETFNATPNTRSQNYPIVVLINERTTSGAEIIVAALKHHKRALIIGSPSGGMGTMQLAIPLNNGCILKLPAAQFCAPDGIEIEGKGIAPDLFIDSSHISNEYINSPPLPNHDTLTGIALNILKQTPSPSIEDMLSTANQLKIVEQSF